MASNDDSCGLCSQITTTLSGSCAVYTIAEGCYASNSCSGTVSVYGNSNVAPTQSPSFRPTIAPSLLTQYPTLPGTIMACGLYSTTNTASATQNYATCQFSLCSGTVIISTCATYGGSFSGDVYLRLYSSSGVQLAFNDDLVVLVVLAVPLLIPSQRKFLRSLLFCMVSYQPLCYFRCDTYSINQVSFFYIICFFIMVFKSYSYLA